MKKEIIKGPFLDSTILTEGNCEYKELREKNGTLAGEIIRHADAPLLAPEVFVFNDSVSFEFRNIIVTNEEDLDRLIENIKELKKFVHKVKGSL